MPRLDFAHVQDDLNPCVLHMFKDTFSLGTANYYISDENSYTGVIVAVSVAAVVVLLSFLVALFIKRKYW